MLEPHARTLLVDSLRPPEGFVLDCGIGTTYSLDLVALLTAPLAFTMFDTAGDGDQAKANTLEVLESLRRYADRLTIFCHAARIVPPAGQYPQFAYLEDTVVQCLPPSKMGAFHPKVWVLRYSGPDERIIYRLLCLSRNLTFDRSWDTVLSLEGPLLDRKNGIAANRPAGDFVKALPGLAIRPVSAGVQVRIDRLQDEIRRVDFVLPNGFEEYRFWPLGIDGYRRWPFGDKCDRLLVVSPFVSAECLTRLADGSDESLLVSRIEQIPEAGKALERFSEVYVMRDQAEPESDSDDEADTGSADEFGVLSGLHAKCYVGDAGWKARIWMGSANATNAAFETNVEFLVELVGPKSKHGTRALLETEQGTTRFRDLLEPYKAPTEPPVVDEVVGRLEQQIDTVRHALVAARLVAQIEPTEASDQYRVTLRSTSESAETIPLEAVVRCWPVTVRDSNAIGLDPDSDSLVVFPAVSFEALTAFYAFEVVAHEGSRSLASRFVLAVPLSGAPSDRRERLLRSMLRNSKDVMCFLLLLLADERGEIEGVIGMTSHDASGNGESASTPFGTALLEALLRTLDRSPERLDHFAGAVEDLRKAEGAGGRSLLPPQFDEIWAPIWEARRRLRS
jgi:hypothetical protein